MKLVLVKRTLRSMEVDVCAYQKTVDRDLEKVVFLNEKMEQLWLQPAFFDEVIAFVRRHNEALKDINDTENGC